MRGQAPWRMSHFRRTGCRDPVLLGLRPPNDVGPCKDLGCAAAGQEFLAGALGGWPLFIHMSMWKTILAAG